MIQFFKYFLFLPGFYNINIIYMTSLAVDNTLETVSQENQYLYRRVYSFTLHGCGGNVNMSKKEEKNDMVNFDKKDFVSLKEIADLVQSGVEKSMNQNSRKNDGKRLKQQSPNLKFKIFRYTTPTNVLTTEDKFDTRLARFFNQPYWADSLKEIEDSSFQVTTRSMKKKAIETPEHASKFEENNDKYHGAGILHAKELRNNLQIFEYNSAKPNSGDTIIFNEMVAGEQMEWKNNSKTDFGLYVFPELLNKQNDYTNLSLLESQKKFWVNEDLQIKTDPKDGKPKTFDDITSVPLFSENESQSSQGSSDDEEESSNNEDSDEDSDEGSNSEGYTSDESSESDNDEDNYDPYWEERVDLFKPAGVGDNQTGVHQFRGTNQEVKDANERIKEGVEQKYNWEELQNTDRNLLRVDRTQAGDLYARRPSLGKVIIDVMVKEIQHLLENGYTIENLPTFEFYFTSCSPANGPMGERRILYKNPKAVEQNTSNKSVRSERKLKKEYESVVATENEHYNYFVHLVSRLKIYNDAKQRYKEYETKTREDKNKFKQDYKPQPVYFETPFNVQDMEERRQLYTDYDQILKFFIPRHLTDATKQDFVQKERGETQQKFNQTIEQALNNNSINDEEIIKTLNSIKQEIGNENIHNGKSDNEKLLWYMTKSFTHGTNDGGILKKYFEEEWTEPRREILQKIEAILSRQHVNKLKLYEYLMDAAEQKLSVRYWVTKTIEESENSKANLDEIIAILKENGYNEPYINTRIFSISPGPQSKKTVSYRTQSGGKKKKRTRRKRKKKKKRTRKKRMKKKIVCVSSYNSKATRKLIKVRKRPGKIKSIRLSKCSKRRIKKLGNKKKRTRKKRN